MHGNPNIKWKLQLNKAQIILVNVDYNDEWSLEKVSFDNTDYTEMGEERIHTEEISVVEGVEVGIQ